MRLNEAARMLGGSIAIYVIMAACSAGGAPFLPPPGDDGGGIFDALTDPVLTASADMSQSGTRLKLQYYVGSDGSKTTAGLYDSQLNLNCTYVTASDGTTRCLPVGEEATVGAFFADSGCSQELAFFATPCGPTPQYAIQGSSVGSCGYVYKVYALSGAFTGAVYNGSPSSCTPLSSAADASATSQSLASGFAEYTFFTLGSELPPSTFVQATVQTD